MRYLICAALCGCQTLAAVEVPAFESEGVVQEFTVPTPTGIDFLFVIDDSSAMANQQANLLVSMNAFITEYAQSQAPFQMGVTTMDESGDPASTAWDGKNGRLLSPDGADPILRRSDYADDASLIARFNQIVAAVGSAGSPYTQGLRATADALAPNTSANHGLVRSNAYLVIVLIGANADCSFDPSHDIITSSDPAPGENCYELATQLPPPWAWAAPILALKPNPNWVSVAVISSGVFTGDAFAPGSCATATDGTPTNACACQQGRSLDFCAYSSDTAAPAGQTDVCTDASCCTALGNDRYATFATSFSRHVQASICAASFGGVFDVPEDSLSGAQDNCFTLDPSPSDDDPANIQISRRLAGAAAFEIAPRISAAQAQNGGDGWFYNASAAPGESLSEVCVSGVFHENYGDTYRVFVLSSTQGSPK